MGYGLWVMVALLVSAPTHAQRFKQEQPQVEFQSTSTMQQSGSVYASQPMLNEDGTAYNPAAAPGGPRKTPTPFSTQEDIEEYVKKGGEILDTPIGDALIPLALMAIIYGFFVYRRKRSI